MKKSILFISLYVILQACSTAPNKNDSTEDNTDQDQSLSVESGLIAGLNEAEQNMPAPVPNTLWDSTSVDSDGSTTVDRLYISTDGVFVQYSVTASGGDSYDDLSYIQGSFSEMDRTFDTIYDKTGGSAPSQGYVQTYIFRETNSLGEELNKTYYLTKKDSSSWDFVTITISANAPYLLEGESVENFPQNTFSLSIQ